MCPPIARTSCTYSCTARVATMRATTRRTVALANQINATNAAASRTPLTSRTMRELLHASGDRRRDNGPVAAVALLIREDRFQQMAAAEIRPQRVGHPDLRVCDLPQQKIADTHFAARADQQIGIG